MANDLPDLPKTGGTKISILETLIGNSKKVDRSKASIETMVQTQEPQVRSDIDSATQTSRRKGRPPNEPQTEHIMEDKQKAQETASERIIPQSVMMEDASDDDNERGILGGGPLVALHKHDASEDRPRPRRPQRRNPRGSFVGNDDQFSIIHRVDLYPTHYTPNYAPNPPRLTFFWACQIDIELGPWASPWARGMYKQAQEALEMMIEVETAGLGFTAKWAQAQNHEGEVAPAGEPGIEYVRFSDDPTLKELWARLRDGIHTWPPYAINARGGTVDTIPHRLIQLPVFPEGELVPPLLLLRSVQEAVTQETRSPDPLLVRDGNLELASIDHWLSHAATCPSIAHNNRSNLLVTAPGIVEELWARFGDDIMRIREYKWSRDGGDYEIQTLAEIMSSTLKRLLPDSPAQQFFVWVALLRATKVMQCIRDGPFTGYMPPALFDDDVFVHLT